MAMSLPLFLATLIGGGAVAFGGAKMRRDAEEEAHGRMAVMKVTQEAAVKQMMDGLTVPDELGTAAFGKEWKNVSPAFAITSQAIRAAKDEKRRYAQSLIESFNSRDDVVPLTSQQQQALPPGMIAPQALPQAGAAAPQALPPHLAPIGPGTDPRLAQQTAPGPTTDTLSPTGEQVYTPPAPPMPPVGGVGLTRRRPRGTAGISVTDEGKVTITRTSATDEALKDYDRAQFISDLIRKVPNTSLHPRYIREAGFDVPTGYLDEVGQSAFDKEMLAALQTFRNERGRMPNTSEQPMLLFEAAQKAGYVPKHLAGQMFQTPADADNAFLAAFQGSWDKFQPIFERGGITLQEYTDLIARTVGKPPSREHLSAAYEFARNATRARLANDPRFKTNIGAAEAELNRLVPQGVTEPSLQRQDRPLPQTPAQTFQSSVTQTPAPLERNAPGVPGAPGAPGVAPPAPALPTPGVAPRPPMPVPGPGAAAPAPMPPAALPPAEAHRRGTEQMNREAREKVAAEPVPRADAARVHDPYSFQNVQPANKGDMDTGLQTRKYIQVDPEKAAGLLQLERYFQRYFPALEVLMPYMSGGGRTAALRWLTEGIEIKLPHPLPRFGFEIPAGAFGQPLITSVMKGLGVPESEAINVLQAVAELTFLKNEAPVIAYQITGQRMAAELAKSEIKSFPAMEGSREAQEARTIAFWRLTEARRQAAGGAPLGPTVTSDDLMAGVEQFAKSTKQSADTILKLYETGHKATQNSVQARAYANAITRAHGKR